MIRKTFAALLIFITIILLGLSLAGVVMIWTYKQPLIAAVTNRLLSVDNELSQAQTALQTAKTELNRTLRIVIDAEQSMAALKGQLDQVKTMFGTVNGTLSDQLIPGLQSTRQKIDEAITALKDVRTALARLNFLSYLNINVPIDKLLSDLIVSAGSMDMQIGRVEELVQKASTFTADASFFAGADFTETKNNIQNFLTVTQQYDTKITDWRAQVALVEKGLPTWVDTAAIFLTVFLLWFGLSQISLLLHGMAIWLSPKALPAPRTAPVDDVEI